MLIFYYPVSLNESLFWSINNCHALYFPPNLLLFCIEGVRKMENTGLFISCTRLTCNGQFKTFLQAFYFTCSVPCYWVTLLSYEFSKIKFFLISLTRNIIKVINWVGFDFAVNSDSWGTVLPSCEVGRFFFL